MVENQTTKNWWQQDKYSATIMIKKAYYYEKDAREVAECYLPEGGYIEESSNDCWNYPCPRELESWSGEINVFDVYDENGERVASIAYWTGEEE